MTRGMSLSETLITWFRTVKWVAVSSASPKVTANIGQASPLAGSNAGRGTMNRTKTPIAAAASATV